MVDKYTYLKFEEVGEDGRHWLDKVLALVKKRVVGGVSPDCFTCRRGITSDSLVQRLCSV